jgi:3-oxoacyl-[acyl-carrier protein] reductase
MTVWTDQIAIVTGGSRGIGRAIARALAARGTAICINYATRAVEAEAAAGEIAATGGRVIAVQADVADAHAMARMVARTEAELGPVSILVNNAGASSPATLESYDPAAMARMRRVNVDGVIHTIRAVAPGVQERGQRIHSTDIEITGPAPRSQLYGYNSADPRGHPSLRPTTIQSMRAFCCCTVYTVVIKAERMINSDQPILCSEGKACQHWMGLPKRSSG